MRERVVRHPFFCRLHVKRMERTQQFYATSLEQMGQQAIDQTMNSSPHAGETYRMLAHFAQNPSANHPATQQHPHLPVLAAEMQHCPAALRHQIGETLLRHMDLAHGQRAAADDHTSSVDRLLAQLQKRNLSALSKQMQ